MKKTILLIALLALVSMMIAPVSAETLTGTLGGTSGASYSYSDSFDHYENHPVLGSILINNSLYFVGTTSLIRFDVHGPSIYPVGAPDSLAGIPFVLMNSSIAEASIVATGTMGYQRSFDNAWPIPNELVGYQWLIFDTWTNISTLSGAQELFSVVTANVTMTGIYANGIGSYGYSNPIPGIGNACFDVGGGWCAEGDYIRNTYITTYAEYTATKPMGLGISGIVSKLHSGTIYLSRAYVFNGTSGAMIANNPAVNTVDLLYNTLAQSIKIGIQDSALNWYNSSVLFAVAVPTVTPTPTTTIPAGYIVTYFRTFDPLGNSDIHGTNISLYDVEAATWTNYSADPDGRGEIYTLPYHTINAYGHFPTAGVYNDAELLGFETGYSGGHLGYLDMYPFTPAPPGGYTKLYTTVRDSIDKSPVTSASIAIIDVLTGAYYGTNSGTTGVSVDTFPNNTALRIEVTKAGYLKATIATNTGTGTTKYVYVDLVRATITPTITATPLPGQATAAPTWAPHCDPGMGDYDPVACGTGKDIAMMDQVRDAGPALVGLAIIATILGLIKLMMK